MTAIEQVNMFPTHLSEVKASEVRAIIDTEAAEGLDFELKRSLASKKGADGSNQPRRVGDHRAPGFFFFGAAAARAVHGSPERSLPSRGCWPF